MFPFGVAAFAVELFTQLSEYRKVGNPNITERLVIMQDLQNVQKVIDDAVAVVGSKSKLARALGVTPQRVNDWHSGACTCTPHDRAAIAGFARQDAVQELVRATLEKTAGTLRGEQLRQVLGKWLHQTGGASVSGLLGLASTIFLALAMLTPGTVKAEPIFHDVYYVKRSSPAFNTFA